MTEDQVIGFAMLVEVFPMVIAQGYCLERHQNTIMLIRPTGEIVVQATAPNDDLAIEVELLWLAMQQTKES